MANFKNILVYLHPHKRLDHESDKLLTIQLENSIDLGWEPKDMMLITNFPLERSGIQALEIDDRYFSTYSPISTKISAIVGAFHNGLIENGLYWVHDLDAFQDYPICPKEINIDHWDMALCYFGRLIKWSGGSVFFKPEAKDIFELINDRMHEKKLIDEQALTEITHNFEDIYNRIKRLNISYNFVPFNIRTCFRQAIKPIRVIHFDPFHGIRQRGIPDAFKYCGGDNELNHSLYSERLKEIIERHL